jgi:hypothetical protein
MSGIDVSICGTEVHQEIKGLVSCILQKVVFKLRIVHIVKDFQDLALEGLIYIDTVGVDSFELIMKAHQLGIIHGVCTLGNNRDGAWVIWLCDGCVIQRSCDDAQLAVGAPLPCRGGDGDCISIE